jgi:hypothetical protein
LNNAVSKNVQDPTQDAFFFRGSAVRYDAPLRKRGWMSVGREPDYANFKELFGFRENKTDHWIADRNRADLKRSDETP